MENVRIDSLETIARKTVCGDPGDYQHNFALEVVTQRVKGSGLEYESGPGEFPYLLTESSVLVGLSSGRIVPGMERKALALYNEQLREILESYNGLIHFLPFQMNLREARKMAAKDLHVEFVNIHYDRESMGRRYKDYCS